MKNSISILYYYKKIQFGAERSPEKWGKYTIGTGIKIISEKMARKLNPDTNIWTTSKPVLENWLKETKDPMTTINETLQNTSEVIKRLPEFPEIMDKANQALTYLASGQIPQNSNSFTALNTKKSEMIAFRNQSIIGFLILVIFGLLVF